LIVDDARIRLVIFGSTALRSAIGAAAYDLSNQITGWELQGTETGCTLKALDVGKGPTDLYMAQMEGSQ